MEKTLTVPIRTDVPPSSHPEVIRGDFITREENLGTLQTARNAMAAIYQNWGAINEAESKVKNKIMLGPEVHATVERVARKVDISLASLKQRREGLEKEITSALKVIDSHDPVNMEIRSHFKSLARSKPSSALAEINRLLNEGDRQTARAILSAPPYLSGLDQKNFEIIQKQARKLLHPNEQGLLEDIDTAIQRVEFSAGEFVKTMSKKVRAYKDPDIKILSKLRGGEENNE